MKISVVSLGNILKFSCKYITHWIKGKSRKGHGIHSPFVYQFVREVVNIKTKDIQVIENIRKAMLSSNAVVSLSGFGAGSVVNHNLNRKISGITRYATKKKINKLLYRLTLFINPDYIVELGTSFGFSTMYMAMATEIPVYTVEGERNVALLADKNFKKLKLDHIKLIRQPFEQAMLHIESHLNGKGLFFIDGDHTYKATLKYFSMAGKHLSNDGVVIVDDINWSPGMRKAWNEIVDSPLVPLTIDLFYVGIIFFKESYQKEHYVIRF